MSHVVGHRYEFFGEIADGRFAIGQIDRLRDQPLGDSRGSRSSVHAFTCHPFIRFESLSVPMPRHMRSRTSRDRCSAVAPAGFSL
jgi:hypothetical protein